ncbi:nickel pincer cofactor biosynthesis protein LarC [Methanobrevibacter filiformis]|uniref:Putative nickel insertion protein n=1 Tax=Methanobrevibacter filiformis TaxID=55758 RepID=A0A165YUI5_9EURY|nr:nickel pincer cofactor biosynthesis protein LarC [Methanobrevibacter filiformis]KZX09883.1 hypothetical protein MBFIL_19580 [Methanobrevibacter filiformis]
MVLIIDPQNSGIAGNMLVGAFIDLGANAKDVINFMKYVTKEFNDIEVTSSNVNKKGLNSTYLEVLVNSNNNGNNINNNINSNTNNNNINNIDSNTDNNNNININSTNYIDSNTNNNINSNNNNNNISCTISSPITYNELIAKIDEIKESICDNNYFKLNFDIFKVAKNVFKRIAIGESKVHGKSLDEVHFHEVGEADAVADVFGSLFAFYSLGLSKETVVGLPIALGGGVIKSVHGQIPIPAPATLEILKGANCFGGPVDSELATPTGSALYMELCDEFSQFQPMIKPKKIAYGAGKKDFNHPNVLRLIQADSLIDTQKIDVIETNVDHISGETLGFIYNKLFEAGARDVTITPTIMKKNRPAHIVKVISKKNSTESILNVLFKELGTLGIRISQETHRGITSRKFETIRINFNSYLNNINTNTSIITNNNTNNSNINTNNTSNNTNTSINTNNTSNNTNNNINIYYVKFKIAYLNNELISARAEFEDIKKIAIELDIPLKEVNKIVDLEFKKLMDLKK